MEEPRPQQQQEQRMDEAGARRPEPVSRTLSISSKAAFNTVEKLKTRFGQLAEALRKTSEVVASDKSTTQQLLQAKLELAQIIGKLEKFQFNEVDAVETHGLSSGKGEVRQERKNLTRAVTSLAEEATAKHSEVAELIAAMSPQKKDDNTPDNDTSISSSSSGGGGGGGGGGNEQTA